MSFSTTLDVCQFKGVTIRRASYKDVRLVPLYKEGDILEGRPINEGINEDTANELNRKLFDYYKHTAKVLLNDWIIGPFEEALKEEALNNGYPYEEVFGNAKFVVDESHLTTYFYENILSQSEDFLRNVIADNSGGAVRKWVRKVDDEPYIFVDYFIREVERFTNSGENKKVSDSAKLEVKDLKTGKKLKFDKEIEETSVYFNERYALITREATDAYINAKSLEGQIDEFLKGFREEELEYRVEAKGLKESRRFVDDLSDYFSVSELLSPQRKIGYSKVYNGLVKKEEEVTASTGDLRILEKLAFEDSYTKIGEKRTIKVETELTGRSERKGKTKISIWNNKDGTPVSERTNEYYVYRVDGRKYVRVPDILDVLGALKKEYETDNIRLSMTLLAPTPPRVILHKKDAEVTCFA